MFKRLHKKTPNTQHHNMSFKFEKLIIWQQAMDFGEELYQLGINFPKIEQYNLTSQLIRASDSVALNISEGSIMQSNKEFGRFLNYAIRSVAEIVTCLHKAKRRNYINEEIFKNNYNKAYYLMNSIIAFKKTLK